jgi:hypothetical protein
VTNHYIRKILLTGQADNDLAVDAFNNGTINKFIQKSNPKVTELVNQAIREAQIKYFIALSEKIYDILPTSTAECLTDPVFAEFFYTLCAEKNIVEFYLTDESASFLMLDMHGKPGWLVIANTEQMESYYEIASGEEATPQSVLEALKNKTKVPYFFTNKDLTSDPADWDEYLHPAKQLATAGQEVYYYAYIDDPDKYAINRENIISYQKFLQATKKQDLVSASK